jgi:hypothetical protein
MKISYPLILVNVFLASLLDPISAIQVYCLSNITVDEACAGETFIIHNKFINAMEAEFTFLHEGRNLQSDDKRELQSPSNCAYCAKYEERWCEEYPYVNCNRKLDTSLIHNATEGECASMVSSADEEFNTLQDGVANQTCIEALQSIECFCNIN